MSKEINSEEIKALIANSIKEQGLDGVLPSGSIEKIKDRIFQFKKDEKFDQSIEKIPDVVSEDQEIQNIDNNIDPQNIQPETIVSADVIQNNEQEPSYTPELPDMIQKASPEEVFVFKYTDISEGGENLSHKRFKLMDNPESSSSMRDNWVNHAKTKAKVYVAKFEEIGTLDYDYINGTTKFTEKGSETDLIQNNGSYKENPYSEESVPQIESNPEMMSNIENYIKSTIDIESVAKDLVIDLIKSSLFTNTETAKIDDEEKDISSGGPVHVDGSVASIQESEELVFSDIISSNDYMRVELPEGLNEAIISNNENLIKESFKTVNVWEFDNIKYYIPKGRISKTKGYIKL